MKQSIQKISPSEKLREKTSKLVAIQRVIVEMGFIIFLFYSNLLMGEFTHANAASGKTIVFALRDIFTPMNFGIALSSAFIGYIVFEYVRKKL